MLTVKEASQKTGIAVSTISAYCRDNKFPNAIRNESPIGIYWQIPETDLELVSKQERGRPSKTKSNES